MIAISDQTKIRIESTFVESDWIKVSEYLQTHCGKKLVGESNLKLAERVRFAVLKLSDGDFERLVAAIKTAKADWRDTLVAADFAYDTKAHLAWKPKRESST